MPCDGRLWLPTLLSRFGEFLTLYIFLGKYLLTHGRKPHNNGSVGYYARVLYSGQPVQTIHGTLDWIKLSDLIAILSVYVPEDIKSLCG